MGIDGGGTGSRVVLVDGKGRVREGIEGGPAVADGDPEGETVQRLVGGQDLSFHLNWKTTPMWLSWKKNYANVPADPAGRTPSRKQHD